MPVKKANFLRHFRIAFPVKYGETIPKPKAPMAAIRLYMRPLVGDEYEVTSVKGELGVGVHVSVYSERKREIHRFLMDATMTVQNPRIENIGPKSLVTAKGADPVRYMGDEDFDSPDDGG